MLENKRIGLSRKYQRANIAGLNIHNIRIKKFPKMSQNGLAAQLQLQGIQITKNTIQRMEAGQCKITDIQLTAIAKILKVSVEQLLDESVYKNTSYLSESDNAEMSVAQSIPEYK